MNCPKIEFTHNNIAVIPGDECISKWVKESGRLDHDQNALPFILKHIKEGDTVIDAGAFVGDHTIAYAKAVGDTGCVFAFEPDGDAYKCLCHNLKKFEHNTLSVNKGLGGCEEKKSINKVATNAGMNYLIDGSDIEIVTIDSLNLNKLDFLKIDCEGYEMDILVGARETIKRLKPTMLIEINSLTLSRSGTSRQMIFDFLFAHNYQYRNIYEEQNLNDVQLDILCQHNDKFSNNTNLRY